jgi:uncharacterized membrane protein required for colicin V production
MSGLQQIGDLVMAMVIVGMGLFGWQHGGFLALLAGMQVFIAFVAALAGAGLVEPLLVQMECPESLAFAVAFMAVLAVVLLLTRLAIGSGVGEEAMRLPPVMDQVVGPLLGLFAGAMIAGTILVAWSMSPLPEWLHVDGPRLRLDMGSPLLRTAARCFEEEGLEDRLLAAYASRDWRPQPPAVAVPPIEADVTPPPAPRPDESSAAEQP